VTAESERLDAYNNMRYNHDLGPEDEDERLPDFLTIKMAVDDSLYELNNLELLDSAIEDLDDKDCIWIKHWRHNLSAVPDVDRYRYLMCAATLARRYKDTVLNPDESKRLYFDATQECDAYQEDFKSRMQAL
jgi:gluconate kinase